MAGSREKILFAVFLVLLVFAAAFFASDLYSGRMKELETLTGKYADQIKLLEGKISGQVARSIPSDELESTIREALERFHQPGDMDPYRFGTRLESLLEAENITVEAVRTVSSKSGAGLEYSLECDAASFMKFLRRLGGEKKYVRVDGLSIRRETGGERLDVTMRVGYEEAPFQAP